MFTARTLLTLSLLLAVGMNLSWGHPGKRAAEEAVQAVATTGEKDDYNPQCLPLDYFEKEQTGETRAKRDGEAVQAGAEQSADGKDEIVAQPGFFVPARRRRPCFGRGVNFTKDCGPAQRAYRVKNFVMAPNPEAPKEEAAVVAAPKKVGRMRKRPFRN